MILISPKEVRSRSSFLRHRDRLVSLSAALIDACSWEPSRTGSFLSRFRSGLTTEAETQGRVQVWREVTERQGRPQLRQKVGERQGRPQVWRKVRERQGRPQFRQKVGERQGRPQVWRKVRERQERPQDWRKVRERGRGALNSGRR